MIQNSSKQHITYVGQRNKSSETLRSVIRLPNKRLSTKAFHINRKINHLSTSVCDSKPGVFYHDTIFLLTELLHMKSFSNIEPFSGFIQLSSLSSTEPDRETRSVHTSAVSRLGFLHDTDLSVGGILGLSLPLTFGVQRPRHSLPWVRSRKRKI